VPLISSPVEMPKCSTMKASSALSNRAKGISTPIAITDPGTA
jgi:hypothetical protein